MRVLAVSLLVAGAGVVLTLGIAHLVLTFVGRKLHPREPETKVILEASSLRLTRETTMWRAWIGFNASHSLGAILFGLVYGYLAVAEDGLLFGSIFLLAVGLAFLAGYVALGYRYWFSVPRRGILLATACYVAAIVTSRL